MDGPRAELRGRGWVLSVQRWRAAPLPTQSSNLGAAAIAVIGRRAGIRRVAVRLAEREQFWVSVTAQRGVDVSGSLADGRALLDAPLAEPGERVVLHRLARIAGADRDGIGRENVPVFPEPNGSDYSVAVSISERLVHLRAVEAMGFDARFGPAGSDSEEPAVYGNWRLP
jgi:hypothetical protein